MIRGDFVAQFAPTGLFVDRRGRILDELAPVTDFREYRNSDITYRNSMGTEGKLTWKSVEASIGRTESIKPFFKDIRRTFSDALWRNILRVDEFVVAVVSVQVMFERMNFDHLANHFHSQLYKRDSYKPFGIVVDTGAMLAFQIEGERLVFQVGPMSKSEITNRFNWNDHDMDAGLFVSASLESQGLKTRTLSNFIGRFEKNVYNKLDLLLDDMGV